MNDTIVPVREIYWNIQGSIPFAQSLLYLLAITAIGVMSYGIWRDVRRWRLGRTTQRVTSLPARLSEFLQQIFGQKRVLRDRRPGIMHAMIFYGFLVLFIGTDIIAMEEDFTIPTMGPDAGRILRGDFYNFYEFTLDTLACKVYVRDPSDLPVIQAELRAALGPAARPVYLQADICRRDLSVEIEATAMVGATARA